MARDGLDLVGDVVMLEETSENPASTEGVGFEGKICGVSILRAGEVGRKRKSGNRSWIPHDNETCRRWRRD